MKEITISVDEDDLEEIEDELEYGDSRSGWIREAIRQRLGKDSNGDESGNETPATA